MANTYKKVYLHIVFAVKNRQALLDANWRDKIFAYVSGILKNKGHYPLAVNGFHDHIHILINYNLSDTVPDLVRELKKSSTKYIKENKLSPFHFQWQSGYGVFSVGWKELPLVIEYIRNQQIHHSKTSFREEYLTLLKNYEIEYESKYVFDFLDH